MRPQEAHEIYRKLLIQDLNEISKNLQTRSCPLCLESSSHKIFKHNKVLCDYQECDNCHLIYLKSIPSSEAINQYYRQGHSSSYFHEAILNPSSDIRKSNIFLNRYNDFIKSYFNHNSTFLDLGCSVGTFLEVLQERGHSALGFELNQKAQLLASNRGLTVFDSFSALGAALKERPVDAITSWEVVSHYTDLGEMSQAINLLNKDGYVFLTTPNVSALEYQLLQEDHPNFSFPFLQLFSPDTITRYLNKLGLQIMDLRTPGQRDVVSLGEYFKQTKLELPQVFSDFFYNSSELSQKLRNSFQEFLSHNLKSGHMLVIAQKS